MKMTFECKLAMFDYISFDETERLRTKEEVSEVLAEYIKGRLTESGRVSITDATLTREDGGQNG